MRRCIFFREKDARFYFAAPNERSQWTFIECGNDGYYRRPAGSLVIAGVNPSPVCTELPKAVEFPIMFHGLDPATRSGIVGASNGMIKDGVLAYSVSTENKYCGALITYDNKVIGIHNHTIGKNTTSGYNNCALLLYGVK